MQSPGCQIDSVILVALLSLSSCEGRLTEVSKFYETVWLVRSKLLQLMFVHTNICGCLLFEQHLGSGEVVVCAQFACAVYSKVGYTLQAGSIPCQRLGEPCCLLNICQAWSAHITPHIDKLHYCTPKQEVQIKILLQTRVG